MALDRMDDGACDAGSRKQSAGTAAAACSHAVCLTRLQETLADLQVCQLKLQPLHRTWSSFFILCLQSAAAARIIGRPGVVDAAAVSDGALVFLHIVADSDCVNNRTHNQSTPLHESAENGHLEICLLLLQCNADVDARDMR